MALSPVQKRFILHWGEMGTRWGVNRTMAQIHALLYVTGRAMPAEEITDTLQVARSNVSTCVRELQGWGVIRVVHVLGDRRDHFESMSDVWEMFRRVMMRNDGKPVRFRDERRPRRIEKREEGIIDEPREERTIDEAEAPR